jgi:hypothetical protein
MPRSRQPFLASADYSAGMASAQDGNPIRDVVRRLHAIDRKLDVLIEAQGLEEKLAEREASDREAAARQRESTAEQFRRAGRR